MASKERYCRIEWLRLIRSASRLTEFVHLFLQYKLAVKNDTRVTSSIGKLMGYHSDPHIVKEEDHTTVVMSSSFRAVLGLKFPLTVLFHSTAVNINFLFVVLFHSTAVRISPWNILVSLYPYCAVSQLNNKNFSLKYPCILTVLFHNTAVRISL